MNRFGKMYLAIMCGTMVVMTGCGGKTEAPAEDTASTEESVDATATEAESDTVETVVEDADAEATKESEEAESEVEDAIKEAEAVEEEITVDPEFMANVELYDEVVSGLTENDYVAFVDLGKENDFLITAIGDYVFDNLDEGMAATEGTLYGINADGEIVQLGTLEGGGTATPLAIKDDQLFYANHVAVTTVTVNDDISGIETVEDESFDTYDEATFIPFTSVTECGDLGYYGAEDFVQMQSGKTEFTDFDDVIANLEPGQGYAKIQLYGCDVEFLAVTEQVFEADNSAAEASIYGDIGSGAFMCTLVSGNGSSYPLRLEDGIIYGGDNHTYSTYFAFENEETVGIMQKDYVSDGDGSGEFSGFLREENSYDNDVEFTGGQEEFDKLISEREEKPVIEFTVVE